MATPGFKENYNRLLEVVDSILEDVRQGQNLIENGANSIMDFMLLCSLGNQIITKWNNAGPLVRLFSGEESNKVYLPWVDGCKLSAYYWEQRLKGWIEYAQKETKRIGEQMGFPTDF